VLVVGLTGSAEQRRAARRWWRAADVAAVPPRFAEAGAGFEEVTLRCAREYAVSADPRTAVLYAHAKGTLNLTAVTAAHRDAMTAGTVGRWREATAALSGHDAAGCFWDGKIFTGNFWWAAAGYLARLPPVPAGDRYETERWVGLGRPSVYGLSDVTYEEITEAVLGRCEPGRPGMVMPPGTQRMQL
jgi:hypothetical protein